MSTEELTKIACHGFLDNDDSDSLWKVYAEVDHQISSDDGSWERKGRDLCKAYLHNPEAIDDILIALCGWKFSSILAMAGVMEDVEGVIAS